MVGSGKFNLCTFDGIGSAAQHPLSISIRAMLMKTEGATGTGWVGANKLPIPIYSKISESEFSEFLQGKNMESSKMYNGIAFQSYGNGIIIMKFKFIFKKVEIFEK